MRGHRTGQIKHCGVYEGDDGRNKWDGNELTKKKLVSLWSDSYRLLLKTNDTILRLIFTVSHEYGKNLKDKY